MEETIESSDVNAQDTSQTAPQVPGGEETPENEEQAVEGEAEPTEAPVVPGGEDDLEVAEEDETV